MNKNENGYPDVGTDNIRTPGVENGGNMGTRCGGGGNLDGMPLAYVYAPNQRFAMLYSARDALDHGTLFEELYKPMEVYGNE